MLLTKEYSGLTRITCSFVVSSLLAFCAGTVIAGLKGAVGDMYVASESSNKVIQIDSITGMKVGDFATDGLDQPRDAQFGPDSRLYVANYGSGTVTKHDSFTGDLLGIFINGLNNPTELRFEENGNLLVYEDGAGRITEYDSAGQLLGVVVSGLSGDYSPFELGDDGNLYVSNFDLDSIEQFDLNGNDLGVFAAGGGMNGPEGHVFGANGDLFAASFFSNEVIEYDGMTGGVIGTFISTHLNRPIEMSYDRDGNLWVANRSGGGITDINKFDGQTGDFILRVSGFQGALSITVKPLVSPKGAEGDLYVASDASCGVAQYQGVTGVYVGEFATDQVFGARSFAFGPDGDLYILSDDLRRVLLYDGNTGDFIGPVTSKLQSPKSLVFTPNGNLLISDFFTKTIDRYNRVTGEYLGTLATNINPQPNGMVIGPNGHLFAGDLVTNTVREFGFDGTDYGVFASGGGLDSPRGIGFGGPKGNLFVASNLSNTILEYDGTTGALVGTFASDLGAPEGLTFGPNNYLWVSSDLSSRINKYDPATGENLLSISDRIRDPRSITFKPISGQGKCLFMDVTTLVGGDKATWDVSKATAGAVVAVVYGFQTGTTIVNDHLGFCATFGIDGVNMNKLIGTTVADGSGHASVSVRIPKQVSGLTLLTQAAEKGTCPDECVSRVDTQTIQ